MSKLFSPRTILALLAGLTLAGCSESSAAPTSNEEPPPEPPPSNFTFSYQPASGTPPINAIAVRGSFNNWDPDPLQRQTDGSWVRPAQLPDGNNQYKYFINEQWVNDMCYDVTWGDPARGFVVDPDAEGCVSDGYTGQNAVVTIGAVPLEFQHSSNSPADVSVADGRLSVRFKARREQVTEARMISGTDTFPMHHQLNSGLSEVWRATADPGLGSYILELETPDSTAVFGPYTVPAGLFTSVDWVADAVGYQIFPERFWNGDTSNDTLALSTDEYAFMDPALRGSPPEYTPFWNGPVGESHCCHQYFGGDLQGIVDKLDHLAGLGVTTLYLNPIFSAGSAHGYDTFDYMEVAPHFGDSTVLRTLLDEAHGRDMQVIWDFVPNHVGVGHWAFQDAVTKGESSDYWDWFNFKVDGGSVQVGNAEHYDAWWGFGSLPELQTRNPEVLDHLLDVAAHWTTFGFDGIRVDVPNEIDNRSEFFGAWRDRVKGIDPDAYLVGEIWERDPSWLRGNQFDALMNYAMGQDIVEAYAQGELSGTAANNQMQDHFAAYPEASAAMSFNLIASHDTDRLLTMLGGGEMGGAADTETVARHRLAAAILYALPGMPMTFQGDECAFLGGRDGRHTARYPVQWDNCDPAMMQHYTELATLKRSTAALASPAFRQYPDAGGLLAFYRGEPGAGEIIAVFNNGTSQANLTLPAGSWTDVATGSSYSGTVPVEGLGWRYLEGS